MNLQDEIKLFQRYPKVFSCGCSESSQPVITLTAIHMVRQLKRYINPGLDSGLIIQAIMDLQYKNLFSYPRAANEEVPDKSLLEAYPEGYHAKFMIDVSIMLFVSEGLMDSTKEKLDSLKLDQSTLFYYGKALFNLHEHVRTLAVQSLMSGGGNLC